MVSRLGFAVATARDTPEILILDEVLSVGDLFFRKKSEKRIRQMIHSGSTVLIVSHSPSVIRSNCTKAVWIEKGRLQAFGSPKDVCDAYEKFREGDFEASSYQIFVNRVPGIRQRYLQKRQGKKGLGHLGALVFLLWLNVQYYLLFRRRLGEPSHSCYERRRCITAQANLLCPCGNLLRFLPESSPPMT